MHFSFCKSVFLRILRMNLLLLLLRLAILLQGVTMWRTLLQTATSIAVFLLFFSHFHKSEWKLDDIFVVFLHFVNVFIVFVIVRNLYSGKSWQGRIYLQISVGTQWTNAAILVQIFLSDITANHRNGQIFQYVFQAAVYFQIFKILMKTRGRYWWKGVLWDLHQIPPVCNLAFKWNMQLRLSRYRIQNTQKIILFENLKFNSTTISLMKR